MAVTLTQAPPLQVDVISGAEVDRKTSAQKVKASSDVPKRAVKSSGRSTQKVLQPPAGAAAEGKEVRRAAPDVFKHFMNHCVCCQPQAGL